VGEEGFAGGDDERGAGVVEKMFVLAGGENGLVSEGAGDGGGAGGGDAAAAPQVPRPLELAFTPEQLARISEAISSATTREEVEELEDSEHLFQEQGRCDSIP
jgi:hypothetical protein